MTVIRDAKLLYFSTCIDLALSYSLRNLRARN